MTGGRDIPPWLGGALAEIPSPECDDFRTESPAEVLPGDICVAVPFDRPDALGRLFIVTEAADGWCEGMLVGTETELATEVDAVVAACDSGLAYDVAVHSRFRGPIWVTQILRRVGAVESGVLDEVELLAWTDDAQVAVAVGDALQPDGIDPRYPALERMSAELDDLTEDCRRNRGGATRPVLDPLLGEVDVLRALLRERGWETRIGDALSSPGFRDRLLSAIPQLTRDECRVVVPFIERAAVATVPSAAVTPSGVAGHVDPGALASAVAGGEASPHTVVLSHRRCWRRTDNGPIRMRVAVRETVVTFTSVSDVPLQEAA